jgi:hypothetical protein
MIDRLITIIIVAALIAWCVLAIHYHSLGRLERARLGARSVDCIEAYL